MNTPLFSVVIPTYNRSGKLLRALKSLNSQTFCNFEVLVCDDGSTDNTGTVVAEFRSQIRFINLRYFFEPNSGGPAHPRNTGIKNAASEWICFLDSDDCWYPDKLESVIPYLEKYDLIYHDFVLIDKAGESRQLSARQLKNPVFLDLMLKGHNGCIINSGVCARKTIIEKVGGLSENPLLMGVEDADLWLNISRTTNRFKHIPVRLGLYFLDGENITMYNTAMIDKLQFLFSRHVTFLSTIRLKNLADKTNNYHLGRIMQIMGKRKEALKLYRSSLGSYSIKIAFRSLFWILFLSCRFK